MISFLTLYSVSGSLLILRMMKPDIKYGYTFFLVLVERWGLVDQRDGVLSWHEGIECLDEILRSKKPLKSFPE